MFVFPSCIALKSPRCTMTYASMYHVVHIIYKPTALFFDVILYFVQPSSLRYSSLPSPLYFRYHRPPSYVVFLSSHHMSTPYNTAIETCHLAFERGAIFDFGQNEAQVVEKSPHYRGLSLRCRVDVYAHLRYHIIWNTISEGIVLIQYQHTLKCNKMLFYLLFEEPPYYIHWKRVMATHKLSASK